MEQFENAEEIDLKELWYVFKSNIILISIIVAVCMILTTIVTVFVIDKQYESYTTLMLGKTSNIQEEGTTEITYNDVMLNQSLVSTYGEIIKSKVITNKVIENLKLRMSPQELGDIIAVNTLNDTEILNITVTHTDSILGARIANEIGTTFKVYISKLMKLDNVNVIDKAVASNSPVSPRTTMNIAISLVLGLMIGVFVVFLREYLNTKIKSPKDIEKLSRYPILAVIPESKLLK